VAFMVLVLDEEVVLGGAFGVEGFPGIVGHGFPAYDSRKGAKGAKGKD
jgi:hypothetical protein